MPFLINLSIVVLLAFIAPIVQAAPSVALGYTPKYAPGFSHFDYVNPNAPKGGELVLSGFGSFDTLNPYVLKGIAAEGMGLMVFETLMETSMDEPFSAYALVAEDMEVADDGLSVTFRINPHARFSDGSPITAHAVKFSFDTLKSDRSHPLYQIYWADIHQCDVVDQYTVRFNFSRVNRELHLLAAQVPIFSPAWLQNHPFDEVTQTPPLASGPYVIDKYDMGKYITYKRNPDYWGKDLNTRRGMFNFERITYKYYQDQTIALEALKAGEFDYMDIYNSKDWATLMNGPRFDSGEIIKTTLSHQNNAGMQGFVFNLRRPLFQDLRVRKAINLAYDFEWANQQLFYGQYKRCYSYFSNSELAARGVPDAAELALLEPFRPQLPPELFTQAWQAVSTAPPASVRHHLRQAKQLLEEAGWQVQNGVLKNAQGEVFKFEIILNQRAFERIVAPFADNLKRLGIEVSYRTIDPALYKRRLDKFDFDMTVSLYGQSQSPGNEQMNNWHSSAADREGTENYMGLKNPVVDALVEHLIRAQDRAELITAARALDRVLLWGEYVVPNWFVDHHRVVYWDKFGQPTQAPLYYPRGQTWLIMTWWDKKAQ
jgi:microcin C transport system substrate-binding protein